MINRFIPVAIPPTDQTIEEDAAGSGETLHASHTIVLKEIVTDAARSASCVSQTPTYVIRNVMGGTTPRDGNTVMGSTRLDSPVRIGGNTTGSPSRTGSQDIISLRVSIGLQWSRYAQPLDTYINGIYSEHRDPVPIWSKEIG